MALTNKDRNKFTNQMNSFLSSENIKGTVFHEDRNARYSKIQLLCIGLFKGDPTKAKIIVEQPSKEKAFVSVDVQASMIDLMGENKEAFAELVNMSDVFVISQHECGDFELSFFVNDIWTEE